MAEKNRRNAGETLVEVMASIFIFLMMMGILQGAVSYSSAALAKNKEIRARNAEILESLAGADTEKKSEVTFQFRASNASLSVLGDRTFAVDAELAEKQAGYTDQNGERQNVTFYLYRKSGGDTP